MPELSDLKLRFRTDGADTAIRDIREMDRGIKSIDASARSAGGGIGSLFSVAGGNIIAAGFSAITSNIFQWGAGILAASANAETLHNSLFVAVGDAERADELFASIQEMAKATPFEFPELIRSAANLEAFGLSSEQWLTTIGNTAAATNKTVDEVTQAVLDASYGEYERLKELGILARVNQDSLTFTYMKNGEQITETVDKNNQEIIASTIEGIWSSKYADAMEVQSRSFAGQLSTLKDNVSLTMQAASGSVFSFATSGLAFANDIFARGWEAAFTDAFGANATNQIASVVGGFADLGGAMAEAFTEGRPISEIIEELPGKIQVFAGPLAWLADSFGDLWSSYQRGGAGGFFAQLGEEFRQADAAITPESIGRFDDKITKMLGLDRSEEQLQAAQDQGRQRGQELARGFFDSLWESFSRSSGEGDTGGIKDTIVKILTTDIIPSEPSIVNEWQAKIDGIALGIRDEIGRQFGMVFSAGQQPVVQDLINGWLISEVEGLSQAGFDGLDGLSDAIGEQIAAEVGSLNQAAFDGLNSVGEQLISGLADGAASQWTSVDEWLNGRGEAAASAVGDLAGFLTSDGTVLIQGLWDGAGDQWEYVSEWFAGTGGRAVEAVGDTSGVLWNAGFNLVWGMAQGVYGGAGLVAGAVQTIVNEIPDIVKDLLGIESPSRVMRDMFRHVPEGMALGMLDGIEGVYGAGRQLAGATVAGASGARSPMVSLSTPSGAMQAQGFGGGSSSAPPVYIDMRGALIGRGAEAEIRSLIREYAGKVSNQVVTTRAIQDARTR